MTELSTEEAAKRLTARYFEQRKKTGYMPVTLDRYIESNLLNVRRHNLLADYSEGGFLMEGSWYRGR
jgi:hypothetical protein